MVSFSFSFDKKFSSFSNSCRTATIWYVSFSFSFSFSLKCFLPCLPVPGLGIVCLIIGLLYFKPTSEKGVTLLPVLTGLSLLIISRVYGQQANALIIVIFYDLFGVPAGGTRTIF